MKLQIRKLVLGIAEILSSNNERFWAEQFEYLNARLDTDYLETLKIINGMYGGAGSFNDVVLHKDGWPVTAQNRELQALKSRLHQLIETELMNNNHPD